MKAVEKSNGQPVRVLGVEDNSVNQFVLKSILELVGADFAIVENGEEAIAAWEQADWDMILMDIQMPVMDGMDATREIRRREALSGRSRTSIVAVTANVMSHQIDRYYVAGMDQFLPKPIDIPRLHGVIADSVKGGCSSAIAPGVQGLAGPSFIL